MSKYSEDGVNVEEEADFSSFAGKVCKGSYSNSPFVEVHDLSKGGFRGPRPFTLKNLPEGYTIEATADGIGTKGILHDAASTHHLAAYDLVAMVASDVTRYGGIPLVLINILDVVTVGKAGDEISSTYKGLMKGLGDVALEGNIVALKGETAQMGPCLGSEIAESETKINWGATIIGAYHEDKIITGDTLAPGQVVVALKENGFRCNGISSVRKALATEYGDKWWQEKSAKEDIQKAATPSVLYDVYLNTLHGWYSKDFKEIVKLHAVVHLSGGAIKEKLAKDLLFPRGLSANLDNLYEPPEIMRKCSKWRGIEDEEFYETWNGGQGMLVVVDKGDVDEVLRHAKDFEIEAQVAGEIVKEDTPQVKVVSKLSGKEVIYTE